MAVDLRLEKFAIDAYIWLWKTLLSENLPRPKYYGDERETDFTEEIGNLIFYRLCLFNKKLIIDLTEDYDLFSNNGVDCYHYLCTHMTRYVAYSELNIFDKMLMSCAVVLKMGFICSVHRNVLYKYTVALSWAMYFETEKKEEFYVSGGWIAFKKYSETSSLHSYGYDIISLSNLNQTDLEVAENIYEISENMYYLSDIIKTFKARTCDQDDGQSCSKCLPMFDVLYSISYGRDKEADGSPIVEGYIQIFSRMLSFNETKELSNIMLDRNLDYTIEENLNLSKNKCKTAGTKIFHDRIFVCENWDSLKGKYISKCCIFCGQDTKTPIKSFKRKDDLERIQDIKRSISAIFSRFETAKNTNYTPKVKAKKCALLDEIEEEIVLRLFLRLGMRSTLSKIKTNVEKEFLIQF